MQIIQSTWTRFHHVDLARELHQLGVLKRLYTTLPPWKVKKESREHNIPEAYFRNHFVLQGMRYLYARFGRGSRKIENELFIYQAKEYSKWLSGKIEDCNVYIGLSGSGLHAGRVVQQRGGRYVMDRGSSNIRHTERVLQAEFQKWQVPYHPIHSWLIEREEEEAHLADSILVPSRHAAETFIENGHARQKIIVSPYGINLSEFFPTASPGDAASKFTVLFVGQFALHKGAPYVLEAFKQFKHPNKELIVVGFVPAYMREIIARIGAEGVRFVGTVPRAEVKNYMSKAHALLLPSIEEGLALVQAQALACGCPVIATKHTGSEDLFTDGLEGRIIASRSTSAIIEALEQVADKNTREVFSANALKKVAAIGGWSRYAATIVEALKS
jgi:glycosyltransferase involved in cell wall biosynthesis